MYRPLLPKVRSLGVKSLKSVWSRTWNRRSNSSSSEASWNPSANRAFRGTARTAGARPSSPGRPRCDVRPASSPPWPGGSSGVGSSVPAGLAHVLLQLEVAVLQLAVPPVRLVAVAVEPLEQLAFTSSSRRSRSSTAVAPGGSGAGPGCLGRARPQDKAQAASAASHGPRLRPTRAWAVGLGIEGSCRAGARTARVRILQPWKRRQAGALSSTRSVGGRFPGRSPGKKRLYG